jgi:hypothetical protein
MCDILAGKEVFMTQLSISIPDTLAQFAEQQAVHQGYGTISDYLGSLLQETQKRQIRQELEAKLLEALKEPAEPVTDAFWKQLEEEIYQKHPELHDA